MNPLFEALLNLRIMELECELSILESLYQNVYHTGRALVLRRLIPKLKEKLDAESIGA